MTLRPSPAGTTVIAVALFSSIVGCQVQDTSVDRQQLVAITPPPDLQSLDSPIRRLFDGHLEALERRLLDADATADQLADAYGRLGMVFHAYGYIEDAIACYELAWRLQPGAFRWSYYLGISLRLRGSWQESEQALRRALDLDPDSVPALVELGQNLADRDRLSEAAELFSLALEHRSDCVPCLLGLARQATANGNASRAVEILEEARKWQPQASAVRYALAQAHRANGDLKSAREHLAKVPESNLTRAGVQLVDPWLEDIEALRVGARSHDLRAIRALANGNASLAAIEFRQALVADPDRVYARYGLALALAQLGRRDEARQQLQALLAVAPRHAASRLLLGQLLFDSGEPGAAEPHLREALRLDTDSVAAGHALARLLVATGRRQEARLITENLPQESHPLDRLVLPEPPP